MKKLLLTAMLAIATLGFTASAQNHNRPEKPSPEQSTEWMAKQLGLDDAQKAKVTELNKEYSDIMFGGFGGPRGGNAGPRHNHDNAQHGQRPELTEEQKAAFQQMQNKRQEYNDKLKEILTADQYAKYEEMHKHGGPHDGGHHRPNSN